LAFLVRLWLDTLSFLILYLGFDYLFLGLFGVRERILTSFLACFLEIELFYSVYIVVLCIYQSYAFISFEIRIEGCYHLTSFGS
jgi:hypothetical protein